MRMMILESMLKNDIVRIWVVKERWFEDDWCKRGNERLDELMGEETTRPPLALFISSEMFCLLCYPPTW